LYYLSTLIRVVRNCVITTQPNFHVECILICSNKRDKLVILSSKTESVILQRFVIRGTSMQNMITYFW